MNAFFASLITEGGDDFNRVHRLKGDLQLNT
jgi:hypothetical protein